MPVFSKANMYVAATALAVTFVAAALLVYKQFKKRRTIPATIAFKLNINVVSNSEDCDSLVYELRRRSMDYNTVGFDCEWVTKAGGRKPVALLQLSSHDGFCLLFRLNLIDPVPSSLKNLLQDVSIYKVGVAPLNDANYLHSDHGIRTLSTVDLRHFAEMCGYSARGLAHLTEDILGIELDKSFKLRCGDWDAETLTPAQVHYAASDAHAAIRIFVKLMDELDKPSHRPSWCLPGCDDNIWDSLDDVCSKYADFNYKHVNPQSADCKSRQVKTQKELKDPKANKRYPHLRRSKPFYDNCLLQAPDGELLSTCDSGKASWYISKGLADLVEESPMTVRLRFEPAGRSVGDVGKYYQLEKKNQCVVCGEQDSYIRKNVVPREYRRFFPDIMKDHSSHDVVLLCGSCHQRSNMRDQVLRENLAIRCRAPLPNKNQGKTVEDTKSRKVRMAARALVNSSSGRHVVPEGRRKELEAIVLEHYTDHLDVTEALLLEATKLSIMVENEHYNMESHGQIVVKHFLKETGGLLSLEELWRKHFLTTMRPQHMPELWSVCHNLDRLRVKWDEGRLSKEELLSIGVEGW